MTLDISKEDQDLVRQFMLAGGHGSPEELLLSLLHRMNSQDERRSEQDCERQKSWSHFEREIDLNALAKEQGVSPISKSGDLTFPQWPDNESVDDFIARATGRDASTDRLTVS